MLFGMGFGISQSLQMGWDEKFFNFGMGWDENPLWDGMRSQKFWDGMGWTENFDFGIGWDEIFKVLGGE